MGVTAIRSIANQARVTYLVQNRENPNDTGGAGGSLRLDPGDNLPVNMWIPWCDNSTDFNNGKNILFEAIGTSQEAEAFNPASFTIWQSGNYIYYSTDDTFNSGRLVGGNSTINGDRSVEITSSEVRFY
jgi:hypothetical protein